MSVRAGRRDADLCRSLSDRPEEAGIRKAGLLPPALCLPEADGRARREADQAIHPAYIVAFRLQALLHPPDVVAPHRIDGRPSAHRSGAAFYPISEMTDEERVEIG